MAGSTASKGVPTKARNSQRKSKRAKNLGKQPERKLRHILKRNTVREAFEWASKRSHLALLRRLCPDYQRLMA